MHTIAVVNQTGEYILHNTYDEKLTVIDPVLSLELNKSGTLTFSISPDNTNRDQIRPMASEIIVYRDNVVYWVGRPIEVTEDFNTIQEVTCEGILGYLLDTQIPPFDFTETRAITGEACVRTFLSRLISRHNSELTTTWEDQRKKFTLGTVTITDSNNNLARSAEDYATTLDTINDKLLATHGGYLRVRYSGSTRYIDYIDTLGTASQPITFGENLLDLSAFVKTEELATNVIPLGAQIENTDTRVTLSNYNPTTATKTRIANLTHGGSLRTLASNSSFSGFTSIYDKQGETNHGRVYTVQTWDDVTTQYNLALKAAEYIGTISVLGKTLDLSAVDLAQIDVDYTSFNLGDMVTVISVPHDINTQYRLSQMSIDLYNPANSTLTLGGELKTLTFDNTKKQAEIVTKLETGISSAVQNATALLSGGLGGYLIIRQDISGQPYEILIMNAATEESATNCVRINRNGIGFGTKATGQSAASWVYRNAWTIDGNLIADFITTGTLNANLIKAGILQDKGGNTSLNMTNGTLTMKKGSINLGSGNFTVSNTGVMAIKKGSINLGSGNFVVNDTGTLTMKKGSINLGGGNFTVSNAGAMKATSGSIGGFTITDKALQKVYTASGVTRRVAIVSPSYWNSPVIYARTTLSDGSAFDAFNVTNNGELEASPVTASGRHAKPHLKVDTSVAVIGSGANYFQFYGDELFANLKTAYLQELPSASSHTGNLWVNSSGRIYFSAEYASSKTIKHNIKPVENDELKPERLYDVDVIQFKYNDDVFDDDDVKGKDLIGFVLEDLAEIYPVAVDMEGDDPKHWSWSPARIIPPMLNLIQDQKKEIDDLKARVEKLEAYIMKGEDNG